MWNLTKYEVMIELSEPMLGTTPCSPSIWAKHIQTKQEKALKKEGLSNEEIKIEIEKTIEGVVEDNELANGKTSFMKDVTGYYVRDYFIKGFFKQSAKCMKQFGATKQLRSKVVQFLFVKPAKMYIAEVDADLEVVERPLRASTPQGERVAIARSECVPAGTKISFEVHILQNVITEGCLKSLLEYGSYEGLGQWRGSGAGRFDVIEFKKL